MTNIEKINIENFLNGLLVLNDSEKGLWKIGEFLIEDSDKEIITQSINLRKLVNEVRGVNKIEKYKRLNEVEIDRKALTAEYMLSKLLQKITNNKILSYIEVKCPPIAEMILDKTRQDFFISHKFNNINITFDIKAQFENNKYNFLCVNQKSFERLKQQSKFFIVGLIDGTQEDFNTNKKISFYFVKNSFYESKSQLITEHRDNKKFTPYHRLNLSYFK